MSTYAEAALPQMFPGNATDAAGARAVFADARRTATLAKGVFGPIVIHHRDVAELLRDKRLRGPGMDLARLQGIPAQDCLCQLVKKIILLCHTVFPISLRMRIVLSAHC